MERQLEDQTRRILSVAVEEGERILREAEAERTGSPAAQAPGATRAGEERLSWTFDAATATTLGREEPEPLPERESLTDAMLETAIAQPTPSEAPAAPTEAPTAPEPEPVAAPRAG